MSVSIRRSLVFLLGCSCAPGALACGAAGEFDVGAHYEKTEHRIAMRDGVKLFTSVYAPRDKSRRYPILLRRTPYAIEPIEPYGLDPLDPAKALAPSAAFLRDGYIIALQDVRGRYRSEGKWEDFRPLRESAHGTDETTDTYDSIEWLVKNVAGHNGRVGQWGISYDGWYTVMGMLEPHPALKAASPQATTGDGFLGDDFHFNGAFILQIVDWVEYMSRSAAARGERAQMQIKTFDYGTPWAYEFFLNAGPTDELNTRHFGGALGPLWTNLIEHPDYDEYWERRNALKPLDDIRIPVLNVLGWFDTYDPYGAMATYQAIETKNPRNASTVVAGPWRHVGWHEDDGASLGDIRFGSRTSEYYQQNVVLPFFQYHLKGVKGWSAPEALMFETGHNAWHTFEQWPPKGVAAVELYLHAGGELSFEKPRQAGPAAHDAYLSDPSKPVPYSTQIEPDDSWRVEDQRMSSTRPDVLTYRTAPLERDITLAGPIPVRLFAATSGTDSDWFVKLIDVYPGDAPEVETGAGKMKMGGYQMLVGMHVMRGKYRNSFARPEPMQPEQVTPISFDILDKFHTFRKGHRIMVQVQSSFFPYIDRNPQTFTDIYRARPHEYRKATQRIHRSIEAPSHLVLPVLARPKSR